MTGILIDPSDEVIVEVFIATGKDGKSIYADSSKDVILKDQGADKDTIEKHEVVFNRPSYKDEVEILGEVVSSTTEDGGSVQLDLASISYKRFLMLLKRWTFKDNEGNPIKAIKENVDRLHPAIARAITSHLDDQV